MGQDTDLPLTPDGEFVMGIRVTAEGRGRARRRLDEAQARLTPERLNEMRAQVGLPPFDPRSPRRFTKRPVSVAWRAGSDGLAAALVNDDAEIGAALADLSYDDLLELSAAATKLAEAAANRSSELTSGSDDGL